MSDASLPKVGRVSQPESTEHPFLTSLGGADQRRLDAIVEKYAVAVVGCGYIDILVERSRSDAFIQDLTGAGFVVEAVSWWCLATERNRKEFGCPHGQGGPMTSAGWVTELASFDEVARAELTRLNVVDPSETLDRINRTVAKLVAGKSIGAIGPCLVPGFWIYVPDAWESSWKPK